MTAAAGRRPGFVLAAFNHISMAKRAAAVKGFSQSGFVVFCLRIVAFSAAEFFTLDINEFAGFAIRVVMTNPTACIRQIIGMDCMRKSDLRPS